VLILVRPTRTRNVVPRLYVLSVHMLLHQCLHFVVAQVSAQELELNKGNLIEQVVAVFVAPVQHEFEESARDAQVHRFQLARLETRLLVAVEREVAEAAEQEVGACRRNKSAQAILASAADVDTWHEGVQLDFAGDFGLVGQNLDLGDLHGTAELQNELLWKNAKSLALPAYKVSGVGG